MWAQRWMWIAWPSFLVAAVLEMLVFACIDPSELQWLGTPLGLARAAIYTLAFFLFWVAAAASSALTTLLSMSPFEVNRCPVGINERPADCAKQPSHCPR